MHTTYKNQAFTLVELIVVVTILSILLTIGSFSYFQYAIDSRDSARITEIRNMQKALNLYEVDNGYYPLPDNATEITLMGNTIWQQGTFGDSVFQKVRRLSQKPLDPLLNTEYTYSVLQNRQEYQISTMFEGSSIAYVPISANAHAQDTMAYTAGNYNQRFTYLRGNDSDTVLALPSIVSSDTSNPDLNQILLNNNLVIHGQNNLSHEINQRDYNQSGLVNTSGINMIIFSGDIQSLKTLPQQRDFIQRLQNIYSNNDIIPTSHRDIFKRITDINLDNQTEVERYINFISENEIGGLPKIN